jgi:hypothetical protein
MAGALHSLAPRSIGRKHGNTHHSGSSGNGRVVVILRALSDLCDSVFSSPYILWKRVIPCMPCFF